MREDADVIDYQPGDKVWVKVGDRSFLTIFDDNGVQRFHNSKALDALLSQDAYTLNDLARDYKQGDIPLDDMLYIYTNIGYSVSGFADISYFYSLNIDNPAWDKN